LAMSVVHFGPNLAMGEFIGAFDSKLRRHTTAEKLKRSKPQSSHPPFDGLVQQRIALTLRARVRWKTIEEFPPRAPVNAILFRWTEPLARQDIRTAFLPKVDSW